MAGGRAPGGQLSDSCEGWRSGGGGRRPARRPLADDRPERALSVRSRSGLRHHRLAASRSHDWQSIPAGRRGTVAHRRRPAEANPQFSLHRHPGGSAERRLGARPGAGGRTCHRPHLHGGVAVGPVPHARAMHGLEHDAIHPARPGVREPGRKTSTIRSFASISSSTACRR